MTGASSGIGLATACRLAAEGFGVFAGVYPGEDASQLQDRRITVVPLDVTDQASLRAAAEQVRHQLADKPLWGLINNAGVLGVGPWELVALDQLRHVMEVNVVGLIAVTQAFLPDLRAARGRIVNISSLSGLVALPFLGPYSASKYAVESVSDSMRRELSPHGVSVIVMQPGGTSTPFWRKAAQVDLAPFVGSPYEAAVQRVYDAAVAKGNKGMEPDIIARAITDALQAPKPPIRVRVQRRRRAKWRYTLIRLVPDRWIDRVVAKQV
ncbi:MAG: SDR family oxidoreductase [Pseudomonadota bacterium]|nr:SDR family oxidoreductase [Pseudomonadota bacterium]